LPFAQFLNQTPFCVIYGMLQSVQPAGEVNQIADQGLWGFTEIKSPDLFFEFSENFFLRKLSLC
jgi:hypothetical protein